MFICVLWLWMQFEWRERWHFCGLGSPGTISWTKLHWSQTLSVVLVSARPRGKVSFCKKLYPTDTMGPLLSPLSSHCTPGNTSITRDHYCPVPAGACPSLPCQSHLKAAESVQEIKVIPLSPALPFVRSSPELDDTPWIQSSLWRNC